MPWPEISIPTAMRRVALVAPTDRLRPVLVAVAESGTMQLEQAKETAGGRATEALERARRTRDAGTGVAAGLPAPPAPLVLREAPDLAALEAQRRLDELAGEAELERMAGGAMQRGSVAAWVGWSPAADVEVMAGRLAHLGAAVVPLPAPKGVDPPTLIRGRGATRAFQPLVDTYATVSYRDLNPAALVGVAYVVMFGMMFGDVGHGLVLLAGGLLLGAGRFDSLRRIRHLAPFVIGAGLSSIAFGLAYGEFFGPTHVVPTLWLAPLSHATTLLAVAVAAGAALLAASYVLGTVNRWREGGAARALLALSGLAGGGLYLGLAVVGLGWWRHWLPAELAGGLLALAGAGLGALGLLAQSGGRGEGAVQAGVELFDAVVRIVANTFSFARLAAFGLTHAALCGVVWSGATGLWGRGALWAPAAALLFVVGNVLAFSLEGLVAGIQALRLEYYELFSRIFATEGRRFEPWHLAVVSMSDSPEEASCSPG
jgi:V/A-type H+/Na+-transporting ATPase subunit I